VPALIGHQVDVVFAALPSLAGFVEKGDAVLLATNSLKRSSLAPDVPAVSEVVPGFNFAVTIGALAATGVPPQIVAKMSAAMAKAAMNPDVVKQFNTLGIESVGGDSAAYAAAIDDEAKRYASTIKAANIKAQ
jgi:tripartite-type tricarboxylate transporter receptor subunit TctC